MRSLLLICALLAVFKSASAVEPQPPLRVSIVPNHSFDSQPSLTSLEPKDGGIQFKVVLTNISHNPVTIWEQYCSWGYGCLSLEVICNGQHQLLNPLPIDWDSNWPRPFSIPPSGNFVLDVKIDGRRWPNDWLPKPSNNPLRVTLRAVYTINPIGKGDTFGMPYARRIWTGSVSSNPELFTIIQ